MNLIIFIIFFLKIKQIQIIRVSMSWVNELKSLT